MEPIRLVSQVTLPPKALYLGGASNFRDKGWLGAAIAMADRPTDVVLTEFLSAKKIDVSEIVFEQISAKMKKTAFGPKLSDVGRNEMKVTIAEYGLGKGWGFGDNMKPHISIKLIMTDAQGVVTFSKNELVSGITGELPARVFERWLEEPEALRAAYVAAAKILADRLLEGY